MKLENKVVLVTGASGGMGRAIALESAKEGARVIIHYHKNQKDAEETLQQVRAYSPPTMLQPDFIQADLSNMQGIESLADKAYAQFGRLDVLVNNAGVYLRDPFFETLETSWDKVLDTNLKAPFFLCQKIGEKMIQQKYGRIINIASIAANSVMKNTGIMYGVSKAGLLYLTKCLALTLAPHVNVNAISPGRTMTEMFTGSKDPAKLKEYLEKIPLHRVNMPEDIAKLAVFLSSEDSRNITGQEFIIDCGELLT